MSGGGGRGIMRILQSLMGGSGEFYSDTTKILPSPAPPPAGDKKNDQSFTLYLPWVTKR